MADVQNPNCNSGHPFSVGLPYLLGMSDLDAFFCICDMLASNPSSCNFGLSHAEKLDLDQMPSIATLNAPNFGAAACFSSFVVVQL